MKNINPRKSSAFKKEIVQKLLERFLNNVNIP